jgi:hypothetical protein
MAISHRDHDHPNTPAARAACRKQMANGDTPLVGNPVPAGGVAGRVSAALNPPKTVWAGVKPMGRNKTKVKASTKNVKKPGTRLRTIGDLPDVPRMLAYGCRLAWAQDWEVKVGEQFNDLEARIVIAAPAGEIALVWKPSLPDGVWGIFFRPGYNSITNRVDSVQEAFELGAMNA